MDVIPSPLLELRATAKSIIAASKEGKAAILDMAASTDAAAGQIEASVKAQIAAQQRAAAAAGLTADQIKAAVAEQVNAEKTLATQMGLSYDEEARSAKLAASAAKAAAAEQIAAQKAVAEADDASGAAIVARASMITQSTSKSAAAFGGLAKAGKTAAIGVAAGAAIVGIASVKMASDFQQHMSLLESAAGEPAAKVKQISSGILQLASATGTSITQLSEGAYTVAKSMGTQGAAGQLNVLKAAAEGAKAENVDLATSTDALTSVMKSYNIPAKDAVSTENQIIAASGRAKTTMADFAGSLSNVLPTASALHLSFAQVGGAIATLTQHGETAQRATQNLNNLISSVAGQSSVSSKAMQQLGINVVALQKNMGKNGLTGTLNIVEQAMEKNMSGGMVVVKAFKQAQTATAGLKQEISAMPASLATLSKGFEDGSVSYKTYYQDTKDLGGQQYELAKGFMSSMAQAKGFNNLLTSGSATQRTAAGTLKQMLGGITGMRTALMLGGNSAKTFSTDVKAVGDAAQKSGTNVSSWPVTSKNFSTQVDMAKQSLAAIGVNIGEKLIPPLTNMLHGFTSTLGYLEQHKTILSVVTAALGGLTTTLVSAYVAMKVAALANMAFDASLDANPIMMVVLGIGALTAGVILLVTHWKQVTDFIKSTWNDTLKGVETGLQTVKQNWDDAWSDVKTATKAAVDWLANAFMNWTLPGLFIKATVAIVKNWKQIWSDIKGVFSGATTWLLDAGKNLVDGLTNGIKAGAEEAVDAVKSVGSKIVSGFKDLLGIHSPSTVMMSLGGYVSQGLVLGLVQNAAAAKKAFSTLASDLGSSFITTLTGSSATDIDSSISSLTSKMTSLISSQATKAKDAASTYQSTLKSQSADIKKYSTDITEAQKKAATAQATLLDPTATAAAKKSAKNDLATAQAQIQNYQTDKTAAEQKISDAKTASTQAAGLLSLMKDQSATAQGILQSDESQLASYATQQAALATQISNAQDALSQAQSNAQQIVGLGDISSASSLMDVSQVDLTSTTYSAAVQAAQQSSQKFASDLKTLQSMGLDAASQAQLMNNFAQTGSSAQADALVAAGQSTVSQVASAQNSATAQSMVSNLQAQVAATQKFSSDMQTLQSMGLDQTSYQQLVNNFLSSGSSAQADALVAAGAGTVAQISGLQGQLSSAAAGLSTVSYTDASGSMYEVGVNSAQGLVNGLQSQASGVNAAATQLAQQMVTAVKSALGIQSPSKVFHQQVGAMIAAGWANGITANQSLVQSALDGVPTMPTSVVSPTTTAGVSVRSAVGATVTTSPQQNVTHHVVNNSPTIIAQTNASPARIGAELGWQLRIAGGS